MTIKHHIFISATISLVLISIIACQQKTQTPPTKENHKVVTEQTSKAAETDAKKEVEKLDNDVKLAKNKVEETAQETKKEITNLLSNGDFSEDLANWSTTECVSVIQEEGKKYIEIIGKEQGQNRLWQEFSSISGHVYKISFRVKAEKGTPFVILRDNQKNQELNYFYPSLSKVWTDYTKEFQSKKNGKYMILLSCLGDGIYNYSDISIIDISD